MDTKNLKNDVIHTLNTTIVDKANALDNPFEMYHMLVAYILKLVLTWLRPLNQWRDACQQELFRRQTYNEFKENLQTNELWKRENIYDFASYPKVYFKIPELQPDKNKLANSDWFSTSLLTYVDLSLGAREVHQVLWEFENDKERYSNALRFMEVFNLDTVFSRRPQFLSLDVKVIWFFQSKDCPISQHHANDSDAMLNENLNFGRLTDEQMKKQLMYNREFIPDYKNWFNVENGMRATSKQIVEFVYQTNQDNDNIARLFAHVTTSGWYGTMLEYAIRTATANLTSPTGVKRKARIATTVDSASRIKSFISSNFNITRFTTFEREVAKFISMRDSAPRVVQPVVNFWMKLRECLIRGVDENFLGESNWACFNVFQEEDDNGKSFSHPRLIDFKGKPEDVDLFLSRQMKRIRNDDNINWGITVYIHKVTIKYYERTPQGDECVGEVPLDYDSVYELNGQYPITLHLSFRHVLALMRGLSITEFASAIPQYTQMSQEEADNSAFQHVIKCVRDTSRWVDVWQDEENDDGEKYIPHPFIDAESLCFEQYRESINRSFANGDILGVFIHLKMWLTTYTIQSSPYRPIQEFVLGATEENKRMLSIKREDGEIQEFRKFSTATCSAIYHPSAQKCVDIGCVYAKIDDVDLKRPNYRGNVCSHLDYNFSNMSDEKKHELFGTPIDEELVKRNKEELKKVEALVANKLTSEALQQSESQQIVRLRADYGFNDSNILTQQNEMEEQREQ